MGRCILCDEDKELRAVSFIADIALMQGCDVVRPLCASKFLLHSLQSLQLLLSHCSALGFLDCHWSETRAAVRLRAPWGALPHPLLLAAG